MGLRADEDPHKRERVGYANQSADTEEDEHMSDTDWTDKASHARAKGEFVRISVPPDGMSGAGKEDL